METQWRIVGKGIWAAKRNPGHLVKALDGTAYYKILVDIEMSGENLDEQNKQLIRCMALAQLTDLVAKGLDSHQRQNNLTGRTSSAM